MSKTTTKVRGAAAVREVLADEQREMQRRAYTRVRPYLAGAMSRLRRDHPAFQTVVFNAEKAAFVLVFGDGTQPHEAPKAFAGLRAACEDLARLTEIERLTADDSLWQVRQPVVALALSEIVVEQYSYVDDGKAWHFWMRRPLRDARYYFRRDIFSRTFYGASRAGFGKRIVTESGAVVDEWVDPLEAMILRALREKGTPAGLEPLCRALATVSRFDGHAFYIWDVLHACVRLVQKRALRRINPRSSEGDARFVIV